MPRTRITRRPVLAPLEGIRVRTLDGLLAALARRGIHGPVITDLSLGEWRSHELARCTFVQCGIPWPLAAASAPEVYDGEASAIGAWIDAEGRGDSSARVALSLAEGLFDALGTPLSLVLLVPRFGNGWEAESSAFLRYLAHGLRTGDRLIMVGDGESLEPAGVAIEWSDAVGGSPAPNPGGLAPLLPGIVDTEITDATGDCGYAFGSGWILVPPEWRQAPAAMPRLSYDRLAAAGVASWLRAYAQVYGNNHFVDPWFLCAEANLRLAEGGSGIALRLMDRAAACARSLEDRAQLTALAQGFRIALMRYEEAAAAPDPSLALRASLRGALLMIKGWGLVLSGDAQRADVLFSSARRLMEPELGNTRQFLYLRNISALARVNIGDLEEALRVEKEIEAVSAARPDRDERFDYVNSINIARLYRRCGDLDLAAAYYERAFATTAGARTESDLIYTNVCIARLEEARGRKREAFHAWLRACLHWLSSDVPEALGWRVLSAVLGRKALPQSTQVDEVGGALARHLRESAMAADLVLPEPGSSPPPAFLRSSRALPEMFRSAEAVGAPGFSVIASEVRDRSAVSSPCFDALSDLVTALIAEAAHAPALASCGSVLVDDGVGREMAVTQSGLLDTCTRLGVAKVQFEGVRQDLPPEFQAARFDRSVVRLGPAVAGIDRIGDGGEVRFRRYLASLRISAVEMALVSACESGVRFSALPPALGTPREEAAAAVRSLEAARVLAVALES
jgi:tetratricopeptide (TPR) repeat protein